VQIFMIIVLCILLPVAGILEYFSSKDKEQEAESRVVNEAPATNKGKHKNQ